MRLLVFLTIFKTRQICAFCLLFVVFVFCNLWRTYLSGSCVAVAVMVTCYVAKLTLPSDLIEMPLVAEVTHCTSHHIQQHGNNNKCYQLICIELSANQFS